MTPRTLCMIVGSAYSGSTLLTALLDRYQSVTTFGELNNIFTTNRLGDRQQCWECKQPVSQCQQWSQWDCSQPVYQYLMASTSGRVVVDSSKDPARMLEQWHKAGKYPAAIKAIHLSKSPIEQVGSYWRHQKFKLPTDQAEPWSPAECVSQWISTNYWYHGFLATNRIETLRLTYSDLTNHRDNKMETVTAFLGLADDPPCDPKSHTIGGNPSVSGIVSGSDGMYGPTGKAAYLGGKYDTDTDQLNVAYDDSWQDLPETFSTAVSAELQRRIREVSPLMQLLGHAPIQEQI